MSGMMLIFVVVFVLVVAAVCALLVLRMAGPMELPESPPFPRRRTHSHRRLYPRAGAEQGTFHADTEDLVPKG
jgi:hypothetical protein